MEALANNHAEFYADPVVRSLFKRAFATRSSGSFIAVPQAFFNTDFYNAVCKPLAFHHAIEGIVRIEGIARGLILMAREKSGRPFNKRENSILEALLPLIAHGAAPQASALPISEFASSAQGMAILNRDGEILHLCRQAKELLFSCNYYSAFSPHRNLNFGDIPPNLKSLCLSLIDTTEGRSNRPSIYRHSSPWGEFIFKAYPLNEHEPPNFSLIGILIEKLEPKSLKIIKNLSLMHLPKRQSDVAFFASTGLTNEEIAQKMSISRNTVKDHLEKIYLKLGINTRGELTSSLTI